MELKELQGIVAQLPEREPTEEEKAAILEAYEDETIPISAHEQMTFKDCDLCTACYVIYERQDREGDNNDLRYQLAVLALQHLNRD